MESPEVPQVARGLSDQYGAGASQYDVTTLEQWMALGKIGNRALQRAKRESAVPVVNDELQKAVECFQSAISLRPDFARGYIGLAIALEQWCDVDVASKVLEDGLERCPGDLGLIKERERLSSQLFKWSASEAQLLVTDDRGKSKCKIKGLKLLPHEQALFESGHMRDVTHDGSSAIWLSAHSTESLHDSMALLYRPMGDIECANLLGENALPATQPYQTIVEGEEGRVYAEKYLRGHKSVDSSPTTVVEFNVPKSLVRKLFSMQSKNEDGAISHGLGDKGGKGLPLFNASLSSGETTFRIVMVKRFVKKAVGAFGAGRKRC